MQFMFFVSLQLVYDVCIIFIYAVDRIGKQPVSLV